MHKYQVICQTTCYVCIPKRSKIVKDSEIEAEDETAAAKEFKDKHRLCSFCLKAGTHATVEFDSYINVESFPGF